MRATMAAAAALSLLAACESNDVVRPAELPPPIVTAVVVDAHTDLLAPGDFIQLEAHALDVFGNPIPDMRFSWTSTNRNIATVDNGLVHALAAGNVAILAVAERVTGRSSLYVRVIPPVIQELEPSSTVAGQPLILTVWGYGFYRGSVVRLNGRSKSTTYVTGRILRAQIDADDVPVPGNYVVTVYNAAPGAGHSNPYPFEVH